MKELRIFRDESGFWRSYRTPGRLGREISNVIQKHSAFFDSFDKIIVYYDNGQIELGAILNTVFSTHFANEKKRLEK